MTHALLPCFLTAVLLLATHNVVAKDNTVKKSSDYAHVIASRPLYQVKEAVSTCDVAAASSAITLPQSSPSCTPNTQRQHLGYEVTYIANGKVGKVLLKQLPPDYVPLVDGKPDFAEQSPSTKKAP